LIKEKNMSLRKTSLALLTGAALFVGIGAAHAVTSTFTANIAYRSALAITLAQQMDFGQVAAGTAATYTLDTADGLTTVGGTIIGGTPKSGHYNINGSALINISAANFSTAAPHGAVLSAPVCNYNGAGNVPGCAIGGAAAGGHTLNVGFTVATTVAGTDGLNDSPSFDLNVVYQ
jgi:hypothetical protein